MTLTEQWKKGELPDGWYYLKVNEELANHPVIAECVVDYTLGSQFSYFYDFDEAKIEQVLAPVPSYEEWQEKIEENIKLKTENKWYSEQLNEAVKKIDKLKEQQKIKTDCHTLAQKLLQVKPELKEWLEVNYKEYL